VTKYPQTLDKRFADQMRLLLGRVTRLESRTASIDSGMPLAALPAVIDSGYTGSGNAKCYINGSANLTGPYEILGSYQPNPGDSVLALPTPLTAPSVTSYVILGLLDTTPPWSGLSLLLSGWSGTLRAQMFRPGVVWLNGTMTLTSSATTTNGDTVADLPSSAWYPATMQPLNVTVSNTGEGTGTGVQLPHFSVTTAGQIQCYGLDAATAGCVVGVNSLFALN
jgi:hypothetical protein